MPSLETERLILFPITLDVVEAVLRRDKPAAERIIGATFPEQWPNDDLIARAFPLSIEAIRAAPDIRLWGDSFVVPRDGPRRVIGSVIFHGRPDDGVAEVGYGIEEGSRGQGLATEATRACVEWALEQRDVAAVQATTFPWHHASLGVIRRIGMAQVGTRAHDILGDLLVFERRR